jgi:hypothetical protein
MPSLLLVVFLLQLFIHLVNTVGAPVITEFVCPSSRACVYDLLNSCLHVHLAMDTL